MKKPQRPIKPELVFDEETVRALCLKSMNMGMTIRQNQLNGYCSGESGKETLEKFLDTVMSRVKSGLNPLY